MTARGAALLAGALAIGLHATAAAAGRDGLALLAKPVPAAALAVAVRAGPARRGAGALAAGLALSAVADVAIAFSFVAGLAVFLLAHLAYTAGFARAAPGLRPLMLLPFAAFGGGMFAYLAPRLGPLTVAVAVYVAAITAMMWRAAVAAAAGDGGAARRAGLAGAVLFAGSDTLIAIDRFVAAVPHADFAVMTLYWAGQLGIAASAFGADRAAAGQPAAA